MKRLRAHRLESTPNSRRPWWCAGHERCERLLLGGGWDPGGNYGGTQVPWDLVGVRVPLPSSLLRLEVRSLHAVLWHSRGLRNGCSKELPAVLKRTSQLGHWAPSSVWLGTPEALPKSSPVQGTPSTTPLGFLHDLGEDEELLLLNYVWN